MIELKVTDSIGYNFEILATDNGDCQVPLNRYTFRSDYNSPQI